VLICVLLDNHSAHRSRETRRFLATMPGRFEFVFTPTHASWLNWVETYFSKMSRSVLRRIRVTSKDELRDRIRRYIEICNQSPVLPKWSYGIYREQELITA
jgi:transposase